MAESWIQESGGGVVLSLHVAPRAKRTEVAGLHGAALKVRLAAPPVDDRANRELLRFVAGRLGVPNSAVDLVSGQTSREKRVAVAGVTADHAACWLR
ncbi:MAG: YggU family protein [Lentisphaerae bacterium]|nr:YggU family protein [Lentisphaerota bacterium]